MKLEVVILSCVLVYFVPASSEPADSHTEGVQSDSAGRARGGDGQFCRYNQKELHTTIRSAALAALKGLCNPAEAEERFAALEDRLMQKLEDIKLILSRVVQQRTGYNEDSGTSLPSSERNSRQNSDTSDAELTHYNEFRSEDREGTDRGRHKSYKRYGSSNTERQAASSQGNKQQTAVSEQGTSHSAAPPRSRTEQQSQSASSRTTSGQSSAAHVARAQRKYTGGNVRHASSSHDSLARDHFASAHPTRSSSVRSVGAGSYHPADAQLRRRTSDTYSNGTHRQSAAENELAQRRPGDDILIEGYRYSEVPRSGYISEASARASSGNDHDDSNQYTTSNSSQHRSGIRQVSSRELGSRTNAGSGRGNSVAYAPSYTRQESQQQYYTYGQKERRSQSRRQGRRHRSGGRYRGQHATHTVSYVSDAESALQSRFREVRAFNDTVYEMTGKRMYSYYWEVKDFDTMMETWEERHSLRSPSFYIYQGGYRMYIRVFPSRQGGNVYLHAGLTPGRYDTTLRWPFQLRLRLAMLDHSAAPDDIGSRVWDPTQLCSGWNWRRPRRGADNYECVGLGFPQELVRSRRYLLDGSVLIKLDVFLEE